MKYFAPVSISLSPNVEKDDVRLALNFLIRPWLWKTGKAVDAFERAFKQYLGVQEAVAFNSGRSALYAVMEAMDFPEGSEVLVQAFTCNAVPNPVIWAGLTPVYVDCAEDFNIDLEDAQKKITPKTRALVVQHTFGLPANMDAVVAFCQMNRLALVEDCAHALGAEWNGKKVGTFGQAAIFSFSRDKVISSVYGGMATTNDVSLAKKIRQRQTAFGLPGLFWVKQQLLHPVLLHYLILPLYSLLDLGKALLVASQALHMLSKAVHWKEKRGLKPGYFPKSMPNALAALALHQFKKLEKFQSHRAELARYYATALEGTAFELPAATAGQSWLRFAIRHRKAHQILHDAWHNQNLLLGDWYTTPIAPFDTRPDAVQYKQGSCPNAEYLAQRTLNLPTHINISRQDAERIVVFLKNHG